MCSLTPTPIAYVSNLAAPELIEMQGELGPCLPEQPLKNHTRNVADLDLELAVHLGESGPFGHTGTVKS